MTPEAIRALRKRLRCTMQELAATLELEPKTVMAWEDAEMFPTKRLIERMSELDARGPEAIVRKGRRRAQGATPMAALADPEVWRLIRKLLAHKELRQQVSELAERFDDPE